MSRFLRNQGIEEIEIKTMRHLVATVLEKYGTNLGDYALSSLKRRVLVYANKEGFRTIDGLISKLESDQSVYTHFLASITVNTTEMFRDPAFWRQLRDVVMKRLSSRTSLRILVAGCSSGEEIYSLAIVLKELGLYDRSTILATDIHEQVYGVAQNGVYGKRQMEINEHNYARYEGSKELSSYYTEQVPDVKMSAELLNNVTFKTLDLGDSEIPRSEYDLILCRNVLIYFNHSMHEKVLEKLENALVKDGFLSIGVMERLVGRTSNNKLISLSDDDNIYRRI